MYKRIFELSDTEMQELAAYIDFLSSLAGSLPGDARLSPECVVKSAIQTLCQGAREAGYLSAHWAIRLPEIPRH